MERTRRLRLDLQPNACVRGQQLPENGVTHAACLYRPLKKRGIVSAQRTHHAVIDNGSRAQPGSSTRPLRRDAERRHACGMRTTRQHTNVGTVMLSVLPYRPPRRGRGQGCFPPIGQGCFPPIETMRENKREAEERREKTKELPRRSFDTYSVLPRNSFRPSSVSRCMLALLLVSQSTIGHSDTSPLLRRGTLKTLSRTQPSQAGF